MKAVLTKSDSTDTKAASGSWVCDKLCPLDLHKVFYMTFPCTLHWAMTQQNTVILPEAGNLQVFSATPDETIQFLFFF